MGTHLRFLGVLAVLLLPARFARADAEGTGIEAGLRLGYAVPLGKVTDDSGEDLTITPCRNRRPILGS